MSSIVEIVLYQNQPLNKVFQMVFQIVCVNIQCVKNVQQ